MTAQTAEEREMSDKEDTQQADGVEFNGGDEATVKFLPEKGGANGGAQGDAEVGGQKEEVEEFTGLTKEDLQQYANDPFWIKVRYALFGFFIVAWIAILVAAILIVVFAPPCAPRPDQEWFHKEVIYNIYPKSFQDTNGDGVGDIKGIIERLDYFSKIGVKALWISSIYDSPQLDGGQDVSDHKAINSIFGTLDDFKILVKKMKKKGMKLLMDFIPNHTSSTHKWFVESAKGTKTAKGTKNAYADYYVWSKGAGGANSSSLPNNWVSTYNKPAWEKYGARQEYYLHQTQKNQPDLNLRNTKVQEELMEILQHWLDLGVDGFVVQNAQYLFEDKDLRDEPASGTGGAGEYDSLLHNFTVNQPENFDLVYKWQELLDNVTAKSEKYRILLVDAGDSMKTIKYLTGNDTKGADLALNKNLFGLTMGSGCHKIKALVNDEIDRVAGHDKSSTWMLSNSDFPRPASRLGRDKVNIANMLQLLLPGTAVVYYGNEIGMVDGNVSYAAKMDVGDEWDELQYKMYSRDNYRTPMQWNGSEYAGFTNSSPWLPLPADYKLNSVKAQFSAGAGKSNLEVFEELSFLRTNESFQWGKLIWNVVDHGVVSFVRKAEGFPGYLVILNFGKSRTLVECRTADPDNVTEVGEIVATSANFEHDDFKMEAKLNLDKLVLGPSEGIVFKLVQKQA